MVYLSYFLFMFLLCLISIYKATKFVLQKFSPLPNEDVQVTSLNHSAPSSSRSYKYDVFISFRGDDVRKNFVDHFYMALEDRQIHTYKDDVTLPKGESIGPSLVEAIEESRIAVIVFSENYANSSWCLDELAYIMKCKEERGLIVIPIFYGVDPSEVRKQKGHFGKEFAKQAAKNANEAKVWKKALADASNISGWELSSIANGHEAKAIKEIVEVIFGKLPPLIPDVDENLVGMRKRLQDLESHLDIESDNVRMIGLWGVGGSGKTTLATSVCMKISKHYQGYCIMGNVREESSRDGLKKLQENMLSAICKSEVKVQSIDEGKLMIKSKLCRRKVLVILDDVNTLDQLEALVGSYKWFGDGSRIIITTRDKHLLKTHNVEVCGVKLLLKDEAIRLFKKHAYNEEDPVEDYKTLSLRVISYADGLPLALKVLGSFLKDKNKGEWISSLEKLKEIPNPKIIDILKISYDGLDIYQKELFLDIVYFWRFEKQYDAMEIFEACYHPGVDIKVLTQLALISINDDGCFDMHDLVEEMGRHIVRGENPRSYEKHSRVCIKGEEFKDMCFGDETKENGVTKVIKFDDYKWDLAPRFCNIVSNMKNLRCLIVDSRRSLGSFSAENIKGPTFLSNELQYIKWIGCPASLFPEYFQPVNLVVLKLKQSFQKELWKGLKHLPSLQVLELMYMYNLLSTPDFDGLPGLRKLTLYCCRNLEEIHPTFGNHTSLEHLIVSQCPQLKKFPRIVHLKKLKTLRIEYCGLKDGEIPYGIGELSELQVLDLSDNEFSWLDVNLVQLTQLRILKLSGCGNLLELPEFPSSLSILEAYGCNSLSAVGNCTKNSKRLCQVSLWDTIINDGSRLLQSMLEGEALKNQCMLLQLDGVELAKEFRPCLVRGNRCMLQLPENWSNDFSGFLMCAVVPSLYLTRRMVIYTEQVMSDLDCEEDVVWEESDGGKYTWVGYVPFDLVRHTLWWDQTYKALSFNIQPLFSSLKGCGVRLIEKRSGTGLTETSSSSSSHYTPNFKIKHDSKSTLDISIKFYYDRDFD